MYVFTTCKSRCRSGDNKDSVERFAQALLCGMYCVYHCPLPCSHDQPESEDEAQQTAKRQVGLSSSSPCLPDTLLTLQPLSLEEMIAKREEEAKAQSKVRPASLLLTAVSERRLLALQPVFLSKQERAELALKRRQEAVDIQKKKIEEEQAARDR